MLNLEVFTESVYNMKNGFHFKFHSDELVLIVGL